MSSDDSKMALRGYVHTIHLVSSSSMARIASVKASANASGTSASAGAWGFLGLAAGVVFAPLFCIW